MLSGSTEDLSPKQYGEMRGWGECLSLRLDEEIKSSEDHFEEIYRLLANALEYLRLNGKSSLRPILSEYECIASRIRLIKDIDLSEIAKLVEEIDALGRRALGKKECDLELSKIYKSLENTYYKELIDIFYSPKFREDPFTNFTKEMQQKGNANFLGLFRDDPRLKMLPPKLYPILNQEIRSVFEKALEAIRRLSDYSQTCFICYNVGEEDVISWIEKVLIKDLWAIGVQPVWSRYHLSAGVPLDGFMLRAGKEDFAAVICTPKMMNKSKENRKCGVATEIMHMRRERILDKEGTLIPILFKNDEGEDPNHVNPFREEAGEPFAVLATLENYAGILHFFVKMKMMQRNECRKMSEAYFSNLKLKGIKILEDLLNLKNKFSDHIDLNDDDRELLHKKFSQNNFFDGIFNSSYIHEDKILKQVEMQIKQNRRVHSNFNKVLGTADPNWKCCIRDITLNKSDLSRIKKAFARIYSIINHPSKQNRSEQNQKMIITMHMEARIYYELGEYLDAIDVYFKVLARNANDYRAHRCLARIYMIRQEFDKAEDHILTAMYAPEAKEDTIIEYAILLLRQARYAEAIIQLSKVTRGDGHDLIYQFTDSGSLFEELNNELYERKKMTLRADHLTYFLLGKAHLKLGNNTEARKAADLLRALLRLRPSPLCSKLLGFLYTELEDFKEAEEIFGF